MKHNSRFREGEQQEEKNLQKHSEKTTRDFESVEELLRFDAAETRLPGGLRQRLHQSVRRETKSSWWRRIFGSKEIP